MTSSFRFAASPDVHCSATVWPAAEALQEVLQERLRESNPAVGDSATQRILELGSGTGAAALGLCDYAHQNDYQLWFTVTEMKSFGAFERLKRNLAENAWRIGLTHAVAVDRDSDCAETHDCWQVTADKSNVRLGAVALDWSEVVREDQSVPSQCRNWDILCGSDLVYSKNTARHLCGAISALLRANSSAGEVIYAHTCGRWGAFGFDAVLAAEMTANNLAARVISPQYSAVEWKPSPFIPPQRVVVFAITLQASELPAADFGEDVLLHSLRCADLVEKVRRDCMSQEERDEEDSLQAFDFLCVDL